MNDENGNKIKTPEGIDKLIKWIYNYSGILSALCLVEGDFFPAFILAIVSIVGVFLYKL